MCLPIVSSVFEHLNQSSIASKMIWNSLISFFCQNTNFFTVGFKVLKDLNEMNLNRKTSVSNHLNENSLFFHCHPNFNHHSSQDDESNFRKLQDLSNLNESKKLNRVNSNSLPDLVPDDEKRTRVLKEIGTKLRRLSESFEQKLKDH